MNANEFIELLENCPEKDGQFNPFKNRDNEHDLPNAIAIRKANLRKYLDEMTLQRPRSLWLGEAPGYNGVRRSGIYLISEIHFEFLEQFMENITFEKATFTPPKATNTSKQIVKMAQSIHELPLTYDVMPFHCFKPAGRQDSKMPLFKNRPPSQKELKENIHLLEYLIKWFQPEICIAIGRKAEKACQLLGVKAQYVRHPSMGGQNAFEKGMKLIYS